MKGKVERGARALCMSEPPTRQWGAQDPVLSMISDTVREPRRSSFLLVPRLSCYPHFP